MRSAFTKSMDFVSIERVVGKFILLNNVNFSATANQRKAVTKDTPNHVRDMFSKEIAALVKSVNIFMKKQINLQKKASLGIELKIWKKNSKSKIFSRKQNGACS